MKKNILVKVGERTETRTRTVPAQYDETGNRIAEETVESYEVTIPVMQAQTVEMAAEDIAAVDMEISPEMQIQALKNELAAYDYIGTKLRWVLRRARNMPKRSRTRKRYGSGSGRWKVRWDKWTSRSLFPSFYGGLSHLCAAALLRG